MRYGVSNYVNSEAQNDTPRLSSLHPTNIVRQLTFSLGNQLLALFQCFERGIPARTAGDLPEVEGITPGRRGDKKGETALTLCMPLTCKRNRTATKDDGTEQEEEFTFTHFTYKAHWFVLSQTEGKEYQLSARM